MTDLKDEIAAKVVDDCREADNVSNAVSLDAAPASAIQRVVINVVFGGSGVDAAAGLVIFSHLARCPNTDCRFFIESASIDRSSGQPKLSMVWYIDGGGDEGAIINNVPESPLDAVDDDAEDDSDIIYPDEPGIEDETAL